MIIVDLYFLCFYNISNFSYTFHMNHQKVKSHRFVLTTDTPAVITTTSPNSQHYRAAAPQPGSRRETSGFSGIDDWYSFNWWVLTTIILVVACTSNEPNLFYFFTTCKITSFASFLASISFFSCLTSLRRFICRLVLLLCGLLAHLLTTQMGKWTHLKTGTRDWCNVFITAGFGNS